MSKKIRTIKRHEYLPKPYHVHLMVEINRQTDRGCAIAATAYLDLLLRSAIERHMRPFQQLQDTLFENRGPLQDLSARIQVAFAFKIIGSGAYLDLLAMRDIRNAFAHSADAFGFDRADIAKLCLGLWYPRHIQYEKAKQPVTPREWFIRGVEFLADGFAEPVQREGVIPLPPTFIQIGPHWPPPAPPPSPKERRPRSSLGGPVSS